MTRNERMAASAKKRAQEILKAVFFTKKIVAPIFASMQQGDRVDALNISLREVRNDHGVTAARIFQLMFKRLVRGGRNKDGVGFKSAWVANQAALAPFIDWCQVDETLADLETRLKEADVVAQVWDRDCRSWLDKAGRDARLALSRKHRAAARKYIESAEVMTPEQKAQRESTQS